MKNLLLTTILSLAFFSAAFAGDGKIKIMTSSAVSISTTEYMAEFILSSKFNLEDKNVDMVFASNINMIQIFDTEGDIISIIPIGSDELRMGLSLFDKGSYKLGFLIEGEADIQYADISVK